MIDNDGNESMSKDQLQAHQVRQFFIPSTKTKSFIVVKETFGSTVNVLGAESGGSESLADFIIKGNAKNSTIH
jgi:hypothetical protein